MVHQTNRDRRRIGVSLKVGMSSLATHPDHVRNTHPDPVYVDKFIVKSDEPGDHWFWYCGTRRNHRHNQKGNACVTIKVKPRYQNGFKTRGEYIVARLLLERLHGPLDPRLRVKNTCGLSQCVNPAHWSVPTNVIPSPWRIAIYDAEPWRLVDIASGRSPSGEVLVRVRVGNDVHLARISHHVLRDVGAPLIPLCGAVLDVSRALTTEQPVTCKGCV